MEERSVVHQDYRFGYNKQERTDEIAGKGNHNTAEFWEYDTRVARRWNLDPMGYSNQSHYSVFDNNPILLGDPIGLYGTKKEASEQRQKAMDAGLNPSELYESGKEWMFNSAKGDDGGVIGHIRQTDFTKASGAFATGRSNTSKSTAELTPYMKALRNTKWYGGPKEMSNNYSDLQTRIADGGYRPYNPEAMGVTLSGNFFFVTGASYSISFGISGSQGLFGFTTFGVGVGADVSLSAGLFMAEYRGKGKADIETYTNGLAQQNSFGLGPISLMQASDISRGDYDEFRYGRNWNAIGANAGLGSREIPVGYINGSSQLTYSISLSKIFQKRSESKK